MGGRAFAYVEVEMWKYNAAEEHSPPPQAEQKPPERSGPVTRNPSRVCNPTANRAVGEQKFLTPEVGKKIRNVYSKQAF